MRTALAGLFLLLAVPGWEVAAAERPLVQIETKLGIFVIELYPEYAPKTVANFLQYVNDGFYDDTLFHRIVSGFVLQGGGYGVGMKAKATRAPIENESNHRISNDRFTVAMARDADPNSATSQFFINLADNYTLNFENAPPGYSGYCVFGRIVKGTEVVEAMAATPIQSGGDFIGDKPVNDLVLQRARLLAPDGN
jgi:cyclophilin family peptidyl-prolyl cis-trans isomerase